MTDNRQLKQADPTFEQTLQREARAYRRVVAMQQAGVYGVSQALAVDSLRKARQQRVGHENRIRQKLGISAQAITNLPPI